MTSIYASLAKQKIGLVIFPGSKNLRVKIIAVLTNVLAVLLRGGFRGKATPL